LTGLEIENDHILEIACLVTDENIKIISDEFHKFVHQEDSVLEKINEWRKNSHFKVLFICNKYYFIFN
jgi:oligoribonuclease